MLPFSFRLWERICPTAEGNLFFTMFKTKSWRVGYVFRIMYSAPLVNQWYPWRQRFLFPSFDFLTLSLSFSFSLSMDLFSPSSSRSISLTVSPDRVLNFFLSEKHKMLTFSEGRGGEVVYWYDINPQKHRIWQKKRLWDCAGSRTAPHPQTELFSWYCRLFFVSTRIIMTTNY